MVFFWKLPRGSGHGFGIIPSVYIWCKEGREQVRFEEGIQACPLAWKFLSSSCGCICFRRFDPLFNEISPSFIISASLQPVPFMRVKTKTQVVFNMTLGGNQL